MNKHHNLRDSRGRFAPKDPNASPIKKTKNTRRAPVVQAPPPQTVEREVYDIILLDKSGSMQELQGRKATAAVEGFNKHIINISDTAKRVNIKTLSSLYIFNSTVHRRAFNVDPSTIEMLIYGGNYNPSGGTALYRAVSDAINNMKAHLAAEGKLGSKDVDVTITMFTDGEDTDFYGPGSNVAKQLITEVMEKYNWTIAFIGAGDKRKLATEAAKMGIHESNVLVVEGTEQEIAVAYDTLSLSRSTKTQEYASTGISKKIGFFKK